MCGRFVTLVALAWGVSLGAGSPGHTTEDDGLVFAADYDGTAVARDARGEEVTPLESEAVSFGPGFKGQALRADGCNLTYPASLLPLQRGSIVMWVSRPRGWGEDKERPTGHTCFGDADERAPLGMSTLWLREPALRFDLGGDMDVTSPTSGAWLRPGLPHYVGWELGTWHQLACTWDCSGEMALYFDGRRIGRKAVAPWTPQVRRAFRIGSVPSRDGSPTMPADVLIDQVRVYDGVLTAQEIASVYAAEAGPSLGFSLVHTVHGQPAGDLTVRANSSGAECWRGTVQWVCDKRGGEFTLDLRPGETEEVVLKDAVGAEQRGDISVRLDWHQGRAQELPAAAELQC